MFRVLERATGLLVIAPPERVRSRPQGSLRDPRPAFPPRTDGRRQTPRLTPLASAPWGEPAQSSPYVVITTQAWPQEWWRPVSARAAAVAAARPISVVPARWAAIEVTSQADAGPAPSVGSSASPSTLSPRLPSTTEVWPAKAPHAASGAGAGATPDAASTHGASTHGASAHGTSAHGTSAQRSRGRSQRGLVSRMAILLVGLLVSVVATETAVRIGRR